MGDDEWARHFKDWFYYQTKIQENNFNTFKKALVEVLNEAFSNE